jgi:hypothetical protein
MKTVIGNNKILYLKSELDQHYLNNIKNENILLDNFNYYFNSIKKTNIDFFMFVVPDKSIICADNIPESYDTHNMYRFANIIKNSTDKLNFIDLYDKCELLPSDYYITDTHSNNKGALKIVKQIMKNFIQDNNKINEIDNFLKTDIIHNFRGDLTNNINLKNQQLIIDLKLYEDRENIININFNDYTDKLKDIDIKYRFCYSRPSKYVNNKNATIKKKILLYGDSTASNLIFELLSFYFEETFFYWNHYFINNDLIKMLNPDIIIDIRTERFLIIDEHIYNTISKYDSTSRKYNYENVPDDFNPKEYIELNCDLNHMTELEAKIHYTKYGCSEKRIYKYENVPDDFNPKEYIKLNRDLNHMTELEAKIHYVKYGYSEKRKYNYLKLDLNFNVYVYCSPKTGGSTLNNTFNKNGYKSLHLHGNKNYMCDCIESNNNNNIFDVIEQSMLNNENIYIIDSYRNPIEQKISSFFQNYTEYNKQIDYIIKQIDKCIFSIDNYVSINEVFDHFNIPYFTSFDFEKKYNILYYKNITFIKLIFEDINEWGNILSTIFNKPITIYNDNMSENKLYNNEYKIIKNEYKIPQYMINEIKNNAEFKIYNSFESQQKYLNYWTNKSTIYKYKNVPDDFNSKEYIDLNEDLKGFTELHAKNHYENEGYKENRKYKYDNLPDDFNSKEYIELNGDLNHMTELEAKIHYVKYGCSEKRIYSHNINYYKDIIDESILINKLHINNINMFDNLILIIDYNLFGGGTSVFLNTIISKYKINQNFLIARNINGFIEFNINDKYYLNESYNETESIIFLENNKNKIMKIFINHILGHTYNFLNNLFNLNKIITYITHDYSAINKNSNPFYDEIQLNKPNINFDINKCDIIVSQNYYTLQNFNPFLKKNIIKIISPLPDYRNKNIKIETDNSVIVIGIIGRISEIKGKYIIKKIIEKSKNYNNQFKFVVFGELNLLNFNNSYEYKNIDEFNNLLMIHKPNLILETSIWPETYSYTLSLSKITNLPILYYNKPFPSVVVDRLKDYTKAHSFNTSEEFYNLAINKHQSYFYTINPNIYFPKFWDEYFINLNNENNKLILYKNISNNYKNIVLITSKINKIIKSYTYSNIRCIYTTEECYEQTINTINSIRQFIPNSYIILFDNSIIDLNQKNNLTNLTDNFININDNEILNYYTNHKYKSLGELAQMCYLYTYFLKNIDINCCNNLYKISGRYFINETFDYNKFDNNYNIFKKNENVTNRDYYYTSFYKLNNTTITFFFENLINIFNNKHLYLNQDYEQFIPNVLKNNIKLHDNLGITQIFAPFFKIDMI